MPENPKSTLTLDLNGHTITTTSGKAFFIQATGGLTIEDSSAAGTGKITNAGGKSGMLIQGNGGKFSMSGGTLENTGNNGTALFLNSGSVATISGGTIINTASNGTALFVNSTGCHAEMTNGTIINTQKGADAVFVNNGSISVSGGSIEQQGTYASDAAIYANNGATKIEISGGKIKSSSMGVYAAFTDVEVTGGVIETVGHAFQTRNANIAPAEGKTVTVTSGGVLIYAFRGSANTIAGGDFTAKQLTLAYGTEDPSTLTITGGIYKLENDPIEPANTEILITAGSFPGVDVTEFLPAGNTQDGEGNVVVDQTTAQASINGFGYESLQEAINAADNGDIICIEQDITLTDAGLTGLSGKELTIEGGTHTIYFERKGTPTTNGVFGNDNAPLYADTKLTVQNLNIVNTGDQGGYASIVGYEAHGAEITYTGCSFENLYAAVYVNAVRSEPEKGGVSLTITDCAYTNTVYPYAIDETEGYLLTEIVFDSEGTFQDEEPVTDKVYATVDGGYKKVFSSIQAAIDEAVDNSVVTVTAGTYEGDIVIDKSITLEGANAGISGISAERGDESIITGKITVNSLDDGEGTKTTVVIDGFKFTGDGCVRTGASANYVGANLTVQNCVAENLNDAFVFTSGVTGQSPEQGRHGKIIIKDNKVTGITGENKSAFNLWYASEHEITGNYVDNINFNAFNLNQTQGNVTFTGNTIKNVGGNGFQIADSAGAGATVIIDDNDFENIEGAAVRIYGDNIASDLEITNNDVINSGAAFDLSDAITSGKVFTDNNTEDGAPVGITGEVAGLCDVIVKDGDQVLEWNTVSEGTEIILPGALEKLGYSFEGWESSVDRTVYKENAPAVINEDTVFEAKWAAITTAHEIRVEESANGTVTSSSDRATAGSIITLTVTADEGYELGYLSAEDAAGNRLTITEAGEGQYRFTMSDAAVTITARFDKIGEGWKNPYSDVSSNNWYYEAVQYVTEKGLMEGIGGGLFAPNTELNRAMLVTILYRLEGQPEAASANFTDVPGSSWYASAVNWAAANKIVEGYPDGTFAPTKSLTREEMATILYRYAAYKGYDTTATGDLSGFADGASVSSWAETAVIWAVDQGVISGMGGNVLNPKGTATRAQVAQVLMNYLENLEK